MSEVLLACLRAPNAVVVWGDNMCMCLSSIWSIALETVENRCFQFVRRFLCTVLYLSLSTFDLVRQ